MDETKKDINDMTDEEFAEYVSSGYHSMADWVVDLYKTYSQLRQRTNVYMSALRLFKEKYGDYFEFDENWDEWKGKPILFRVDVYPNEDRTKMTVKFVDEEKKDD